MKRIIALTLVLSFILMSVACANSSEPVSGEITTQAVSETEAETRDPYLDDIEEHFDFDGDTYTIACPNPYDLGCVYYVRDEINGDIVNDAIYNRNFEIQERFNISIDTIAVGWTDAQFKDLTPMLMAGDDSVDLIALGFMQGGVGMVTSGLCVPWNMVPYINMEKPYWNQNITDSLAINDDVYLLIGDLNWTTMCETAVCFFNKNVAEDFNVGDLYARVENNEWTFDDLYQIAVKVPQDINGDGKFNTDDQYGCIQNTIIGIYSYTIAANYYTVLKGDGEANLNIMTDKMQSIVDYVYKLCYENNTSFVDRFDYAKDSQGVQIFFDDRALFLLATLEHGEYFRSFDSDFGILPYPKYDAGQEKYCSTSDQWGLACVMPSTATNFEFNGIITEALCSASSRYITGAYYDKVLVGKQTRDNESEKMLDIVFGNLIYDFGICYCSNLDFIVLEALIKTKKTDLSSWYAKNEKILKRSYQKLYDYVPEWEQNG